LEKGVYKVFAGLVLVSMIGALVAEPVALGDLGAVYYYKHHNDQNGYIDDGKEYADTGYHALKKVWRARGVPETDAIIEDAGETILIEDATDAALVAALGITGAGLLAFGVGLVL